MRKYYLMEVDNDTHKYKMIKVADKYGLSLEVIDFITTKFMNEESFKNKLFQNGRISSMDSSIKIIYFDGDKIISKRVKYYHDIVKTSLNKSRISSVGDKRFAKTGRAVEYVKTNKV